MYALCSRASLARCVPRVPIFSRANFTSNSLEEPKPNPTTKPGSRIASSWGNIVIRTSLSNYSRTTTLKSHAASREEILHQQKQPEARAYTPDLSYLAADKSSSLASRLAADLTIPSKQPAPSPVKKTFEAASTHLTDKPSSGTPPRQTESPEERALRMRALTDARKAERQAREEAAAAVSKARKDAAEARRAYIDDAARAASERVAHLTAQRTVERLKREAMAPRQTFEFNVTRALQRQVGRGSPRGTREGRKAKPLGPRKPKFQIMTSTSQDNQIVNESEDITWEIIEEGGDKKEPAQFTDADISFADLDNLFQPTFEQRVDNAIRTPGSVSLKKGQVQRLREVYAGDYQCIAPQTSQDFVTSPHELGPLKHADLVLSQRSDVSAGGKQSAVAIISSAIGSATRIRDVQAVVN
ncbi:hypothetical protein H0H87_012401 [Tephrocybe sp. NHM501043]|nr:hypothetical protein H0H87_012401 [Tephrocybe sp. NHM501043]